jgi:hypothetical protein
MRRINVKRSVEISSLFMAIAVALAAGTSGCSVDFQGLLAGGESQTDTLEGRIRSDIVTVRFRNLTAREAVNVEFHATNDVLTNLPDDLFSPDRLILASVGVAGTGIIEPLNFDVIEMRCTGTLTLGTLGGVFLDNESGELRGRGTARWLEEGPLALCGSVVTFEFLGDGNSFMTVVSVRR